MDYKTRKAKLAIDGGSKDISNDISITIELKGVVPVLHLSQSEGVGSNTTSGETTAKDVVYNLAVESKFTAKKDPSEVKNYLVDPEDTDRFIYIGHAEFTLRKTIEYYYYDAKFKDIIAIPDVSQMFDQNTIGDSLKTREFIVAGKMIHSNLFLKFDEGETGFMTLDKRPSAFPTPQDIEGLKTHVMVLPNTFDEYAVNNSGILFNDRYIEGHFGKLVELVSFGSTRGLFGDDMKQAAHLLHRNDRKNYRLTYIGSIQLDDILVPYL